MVPRPHYASPECQYYLTLLKDDLQIKQGAYSILLTLFDLSAFLEKAGE